MFQMPQWVTAHWHDVKGNAKWDFIKWGAVFMIAMLAAIVRFLQKAPLWEVVIVVISICICVWFVISAIQKRIQLDGKPFQPDSRSLKLFTTMVDLIKSDTRAPGRSIEPVGTLIKYSNKIRTEGELEWLSGEFVRHQYLYPFELFELNAGDFLKGQRLQVLRDARHQPGEINTQSEFMDFLTTMWGRCEEWKEAKNNWLIAVEEAGKKERKIQMLQEFTVLFRALGDRRRMIHLQGSDYYEQQCRLNRGDIETPGLVGSVSNCIKHYLGEQEHELFISDAGAPKISDDDPHKGWKAVMQFLERCELRLQELIRKHT
jgi:hypothetical protein